MNRIISYIYTLDDTSVFMELSLAVFFLIFLKKYETVKHLIVHDFHNIYAQFVSSYICGYTVTIIHTNTHLSAYYQAYLTTCKRFPRSNGAMINCYPSRKPKLSIVSIQVFWKKRYTLDVHISSQIKRVAVAENTKKNGVLDCSSFLYDWKRPLKYTNLLQRFIILNSALYKLWLFLL